MAEKRVIEIEVNTKGAVKSMDALEKATNDVSKSFADVYGDLQPLTARMGEAEDRLYELANAGKTTSQEYKDLLKSVGDFRKVQISTDMAVDAAASTLGQKLGGALSGVTSGFSLAQGAFAAFGSESKAVEEALLKVQSAMAIQQGVQGIREAIPAIRELGNSIKAAIGSTGIGLLVVALGAVVAYWEDISNALYKNTRARELNNKVQSSSVELISKELNAADVLTKQLKSETFTREEKRKKVAAFQKEYPSILSNINAEKTSLQDINIALSKNIGLLKLQAQAKAIQALREESYTELVKKQMELTTGAAKKDFTLFGADFGGVAYGEDATNGILSFVDANEGAAISTKIATKELEKNISALDKMDAALQKQMIALEKQGAVIKTSGKVETDFAKEKADRIKLINDNLIAYYDAIESERQSKITSDKEKELQELANKYEKLYELADKAGQSTKDLQEQQGKDSQAITKKYDDLDKIAKEENTKKELQMRRDSASTVISEMVAAGTKRLEGEKLISEKSIEIAKAEADKKRELTKKGIDMAMSALSILNDAFQMSAGKSEKDQRKAFKAQKAFNLASALTNTYLAVASALALNPKDSLFPGQRFVEAGLAGAAGAIQVAKIASTQFTGGGTPSADTGSGNVPTAPTMSAPQFNVVGQSGVNQLASLNQQPIQAYVVSGQVTSQQALDRNRLANATLGG